MNGRSYRFGTATRDALLHISAALLLLVGCGADCSDPRLLETGTYRSVLVYQFSGVQPKNAFPHKRGKSVRMTLYRDLQEVKFEYVRDGKTVVETWTCIEREVIDTSAPAAGSDGAGTTDSSSGGSDTVESG